jgi:hypothetical protein
MILFMLGALKGGKRVRKRSKPEVGTRAMRVVGSFSVAQRENSSMNTRIWAITTLTTIGPTRPTGHASIC